MRRPRMRLSDSFLSGLFAVCLLAPGSSVAAEAGKVALTFDDLPALTLFKDQPYVNYLNDMLLRGLKRHRLPAIGFVNEGKLDAIDRPQQIANLRKWLDAGMTIGNHTFSHESPDALGAKGYIDDIVRVEPVTHCRLVPEGVGGIVRPADRLRDAAPRHTTERRHHRRAVGHSEATQAERSDAAGGDERLGLPGP